MSRTVRNINLIGALLIGLCVFYAMPHAVMFAGKNDFVHLYVGASLYGSTNIYSVDEQLQLQARTVGEMRDSRIGIPTLFVRPPFYGFLLKPLSWLTYKWAYLSFQLFSFTSLLLSLLYFARANDDLLPLAVMSPPLIASLILGQDVALLLGLLTLTILLARKGSDFVAGLVLSLCAVKFHLFMLVPIAVLFHKRWKILQGATMGGVILAAIGLGSGGFAVYEKFFGFLINPDNSPQPGMMPNLRGFVYNVTGGDHSMLLLALSLAVAGMVCWLAWRSQSFEAALAYCLIGGLLVNVHTYLYDCLLLLPALALLSKAREPKAVIRMVTISALPFGYVLLLAGTPYSPLFHLLLGGTLVTAALSQVPSRREAPALEPAEERVAA